MNRGIYAVLATAAVAVACGGSGSGEDPASAAPEVKAAPAGKHSKEEIKALFDKVDSNCAGNDNGFTAAFKPTRFKADKIANKLKSDDKDAMGTDCSKERAYSSSREDAVKMFRDHVNDKNEDTKSCLATNLSDAERRTLDEIVSDPTNLGVFASIHAGGDNPEACTYYNFEIYRADGLEVRFVFNFTD